MNEVAAGLSAVDEGRPVGRSAGSEENGAKADVAQLAERVLGKDEVTSSILVIGSTLRSYVTRRVPTVASAEVGRSAGEGSQELRVASQPRSDTSELRLAR